MTRREAYDYGVEQLEEEGIDNADCDVRILLEDLCGVDREELFIHGDKSISRKEQEKFVAAINRRMGHYPVQYITGKQDFMGLTFSVNQNVLIPRMDTEILVEAILKQLDDGSRILDMCTGSGCILLSLLRYSNDCEGVGVDISEEALEVAKDNAGRLALDETFDMLFQTGGIGRKHIDPDKVEFVQSNLFNDVNGKFDMYGGAIKNCSAKQGGGIQNNGSLTVTDTAVISGCSSTDGKYFGGALYNSSLGETSFSGSSQITDCNSISVSASKFIISDNAFVSVSYIEVFRGNLTVKDNAVLKADEIETAVQNSGISIIFAGKEHTIKEIYSYNNANVVFETGTTTATYIGAKGKATIQIKGGTVNGKINLRENATMTMTGGVHIGTFEASSPATAVISDGWLSWNPGIYSANGTVGIKKEADTPDARAPYTVGFVSFYLVNGNDKQGPLASQQSKTVPTNVFVKKGFKFGSWNTKADGTGKKYMPNDKIDFQDGTCLYIQWEVDTSVPRKATLVDPLGKWNDKYATANGTKLNITEKISPFSKYDYTITSWNTDPNGNGINFPIGSVLDFGDNLEVTLYAQWTKIERMNFNSADSKMVTFHDDTKNNPDFQFAVSGASVFLSSNGFTRSGYNLAGWSDGVRTYREGERYFLSTEKNDVLTAVWVEKGSSSYFSVGGTEESSGNASQIITLPDDDNGGSGSAYAGEGDANQIIYHDNVGKSTDILR